MVSGETVLSDYDDRHLPSGRTLNKNPEVTL